MKKTGMEIHISPVVKSYNRSYRLMQIATELAYGCFAGFWLGLMNRNQIHEIDQTYYSTVKTYRDEEYNLSGLFSWEQACLKEYFSDVKSILLLGAGGGREVLALHQLGYSVDAFECHPGLQEFANEFFAQQRVPCRVELMPRDHCPAVEKIYDGVIAGWGMYMLIQGSGHRIALLKELRKVMQAGSPLLLSFFERSGVGVRLRVLTKTSNLFRRLLRREPVDLGDDLQPDFVHLFTKDEINNELCAAGFRLVKYSDDDYGHAVAVADQLIV